MPLDGAGHGATPLGELVDVFQVRQYFNAMLGVNDLAHGLVHDIGFANDLRRAVLRLPFDRRPRVSAGFPPPRARGPGIRAWAARSRRDRRERSARKHHRRGSGP